MSIALAALLLDFAVVVVRFTPIDFCGCTGAVYPGTLLVPCPEIDIKLLIIL